MRRLLDGDADELLVPVRLSTSKRGSRQPWRGVPCRDFTQQLARFWVFLLLDDNIILLDYRREISLQTPHSANFTTYQ
jgi:hypothetical protein